MNETLWNDTKIEEAVNEVAFAPDYLVQDGTVERLMKRVRDEMQACIDELKVKDAPINPDVLKKEGWSINGDMLYVQLTTGGFVLYAPHTKTVWYAGSPVPKCTTMEQLNFLVEILGGKK